MRVLNKRFIIFSVGITVVLLVSFTVYMNLRDIFRGIETRRVALDARLEKAEQTALTLQKDGFVERPSMELFYNKVLPAVVFIHGVSAKKPSPGGQPAVLLEPASTLRGTGFFISSDGYIATAKHIIDGLDVKNIRVQNGPADFYTAKVVAEDSASDIAILRVKGEAFTPVELGYFENIRIGEAVGLIGYNPGFAVPLLHSGSVSAKGIDGGMKIFTINSFVNNGNSGSPVFSLLSGRVIGIVGSRKNEYLNRKPLNPEEYSSGMRTGGGIDPTRFTAEIYNETLALVAEVSQVGIGFVYSTDELQRLLKR